MNKKAKFILTTVFILLTRGFDAYCTGLHTPDLSKEANPLVSVLGLGWGPLLLIIAALTFYVIYCYYNAIFKPYNLLPSEKGYSFGNTVAYSFLGKKGPWYSVFYQLPTSLKRFNAYIGYTMPACLVFAGVVSTAMWLLINNTTFYAPYHNATAIYMLLIAGSVIIFYNFHRKLYSQYLQKMI